MWNPSGLGVACQTGPFIVKMKKGAFDTRTEERTWLIVIRDSSGESPGRQTLPRNPMSRIFNLSQGLKRQRENSFEIYASGLTWHCYNSRCPA